MFMNYPNCILNVTTSCFQTCVTDFCKPLLIVATHIIQPVRDIPLSDPLQDIAPDVVSDTEI